jgi:NAD(P)-dependent dehydrogenase (short-subunit alcohol dehydrogenase family)
MNRPASRPEAADPVLGMTDAELAVRPTVFRDRLLEGQTRLVSGGGSGMGKSIAFLAARLGANIAICGRRADKLEKAAEAIEAATGRPVLPVAMTIREPDHVEALVDAVHARFGGLSALINNAGGQFPQDAIDFSRKGWLAVIDTNLNGSWWMMQEAARRWIAAGAAGNIINIVAQVERGMPQAAHSCAARAGVIYLSKTVATEWAPHRIRVNCIAPGVIETEGFHVYPEHALKRFHEANPMKTRGDAWDVAEAVVYLAAPSARFITGECLVIDGGQSQWGVVWPAGMPDWFNVNGGA